MPTQLTRTDPLRDFKFRVQIIPNGGELSSLTEGIGYLGFAVVSGLAVQNEVIPYREGGMNTHHHKMVGMSDFTPVTFSRGVFSNQAQMWKWQSFMHSWMQGTNVGPNGSKGQDTDYRCQINVSVLDHPYTAPATYEMDPSSPGSTLYEPGNVRLSFTLHNCWPGGFALSDLNAGASSIMVQQLTIHHEGFEIDFADA